MVRSHTRPYLGLSKKRDLSAEKVIGKSYSNIMLNLLEVSARKASTFFSVVHSGVMAWRDGVDVHRLKWWELLQYQKLRPAISWKRDLVVYDVGAHAGHFASLVARSGLVSRVYCFEPISQVFEALTETTRTNAKIKCFQVAVGDRNGSEPMQINDFSASSSMLPMESLHVDEFPHTKKAREEDVDVRTLTELVRVHKLLPPDFIKIDVQGFEDRVIRGGEAIVRNAKFCLLELSLASLYQGSMLIVDINAIMRRLGFRLVAFINPLAGRSGELLQVDGLFRRDDS